MQFENKQQGKAVLAALQKLAEADGLVCENEQGWLDRLGQELQIEPTRSSHFNLDELSRQVVGPEQRQELIRLLLLVSLADGQATEAELEFIHKVARRLQIPEGQVGDWLQSLKEAG
mgnify:CR=1 FL=1